VKFFGASFLSRTSALVKERAAGRGRLEVGAMMQMPQLLLALICLMFGIMPAIGYGLVHAALAASPQGFGKTLGGAPAFSGGLWTGLSGVESHSILGLAFLAARFISRLGAAPSRAAPPWLCGYAREAECNRYVAHGYYGEIKRYFRWLGGAPPAPSVNSAAPKEH
jgi:hypothetical protein